MLAGTAVRAATTLTAWLSLVSLGGLAVAGAELCTATRVACAAIAVPIALVAAIGTLSAIWRGPQVIAFDRGDAASCGPVDAETIRAGAQLRGTMGGAGHLHPARLVFPTLAWGAALVCGAEAVSARAAQVAGAWPVAVALAAAVTTLFFPARPFWYREVTGGAVLVSPPEAAAALLAARALRAQVAARSVEPDQGG